MQCKKFIPHAATFSDKPIWSLNAYDLNGHACATRPLNFNVGCWPANALSYGKACVDLAFSPYVVKLLLQLVWSCCRKGCIQPCSNLGPAKKFIL